MIIAGIDEAGYGPVLGPLVVGCCAFEIPGNATDPLPCLWDRLRKYASRQRSKTGQKLHINDSKAVYSSSGGLRELERSVLAMASAGGSLAQGLGDFLQAVDGDLAQHLRNYEWYAAGEGEPWPVAQDAISVQTMANALRLTMQQTETSLVHLHAHIMLEREYNRMVEQTRNKSSVLWSVAVRHLDHLLNHYGDKQLVVFCDRHGGRSHYGPSLRLMFDAWELEIVREDDGYSEYKLLRDGHAVRIVFCEKAESQCMSVALASMLSKYCRETLMGRFNTWWKQHVPGIAPTAGYYTDGMRFLREIDAVRQTLGIRDEMIVRSR